MARSMPSTRPFHRRATAKANIAKGTKTAIALNRRALALNPRLRSVRPPVVTWLADIAPASEPERRSGLDPAQDEAQQPGVTAFELADAGLQVAPVERERRLTRHADRLLASGLEALEPDLASADVVLAVVAEA